MEPEVKMWMEADTAHRFLLGKVNVTVALARGQIKAKGPVAKILKLVPLTKPVFPRYKAQLEAQGREDLIERRPSRTTTSSLTDPDRRRPGNDRERRLRVRKEGGERPLIVTDAVIRETGLTEKVEEGVAGGGLEVAGVFDDVPQDSVTTVERARRRPRPRARTASWRSAAAR